MDGLRPKRSRLPECIFKIMRSNEVFEHCYHSVSFMFNHFRSMFPICSPENNRKTLVSVVFRWYEIKRSSRNFTELLSGCFNHPPRQHEMKTTQPR